MEIITFIAVSSQAKFLEKLGATFPALFLTGSSTVTCPLAIKPALEEAIVDLVMDSWRPHRMQPTRQDFSRGSPLPRDQTWVSCIAGELQGATREAVYLADSVVTLSLLLLDPSTAAS